MLQLPVNSRPIGSIIVFLFQGYLFSPQHSVTKNLNAAEQDQLREAVNKNTFSVRGTRVTPIDELIFSSLDKGYFT